MNVRELAMKMVRHAYQTEFVISNTVEMLKTRNGFDVLEKACMMKDVHTKFLSFLLNKRYPLDKALYLIEQK